MTHRNVANLICQYPGNVGVSPGTRVGQVLNISFDMGKLFNIQMHILERVLTLVSFNLAAWEIFSALCNGGTLVIRGSIWEATISQVC